MRITTCSRSSRLPDPFAEGYLRLQSAGANVILPFDSDGGADSFVNIASLVDPPSITLADIIYSGPGCQLESP